MARPKNPIKPGDGDPRHGTMNGYFTHHCPCPLCRAKGTEYSQNRRAGRRGVPGGGRAARAPKRPEPPPKPRPAPLPVPPQGSNLNCQECRPGRACYYHAKVAEGLISV